MRWLSCCRTVLSLALTSRAWVSSSRSRSRCSWAWRGKPGVGDRPGFSTRQFECRNGLICGVPASSAASARSTMRSALHELRRAPVHSEDPCQRRPVVFKRIIAGRLNELLALHGLCSQRQFGLDRPGRGGGSYLRVCLLYRSVGRLVSSLGVRATQEPTGNGCDGQHDDARRNDKSGKRPTGWTRRGQCPSRGLRQSPCCVQRGDVARLQASGVSGRAPMERAGSGKSVPKP